MDVYVTNLRIEAMEVGWRYPYNDVSCDLLELCRRHAGGEAGFLGGGARRSCETKRAFAGSLVMSLFAGDVLFRRCRRQRCSVIRSGNMFSVMPNGEALPGQTWSLKLREKSVYSRPGDP